MKKQYRYEYGRAGSFEVNVFTYHDGILIDMRTIYQDELEDMICKLHDEGYTYGFTERELNSEKNQYERMLANVIRRNDE